MTVHINNSDEEGVMRSLPAMKEAMVNAITDDIATGGKVKDGIMEYIIN